MSRWGMAVDLDRCTACGACMAACHQENNLAAAGPEQSEADRAFHWIRLIPEDVGAGRGSETALLPKPCLQCDNPPCVKVCPVHATYLGEDGIVGQIYARCIGCRYCMAACPYNAKVFNWLAPDWPIDLAQRVNPDVSMRPKGVVEKCTFCHHRIQRARDDAAATDRALRDGDVIPACAESCPARAIVFGDLDDPDSAVSQLANSSRAFRLHEDLGTEPKVYYLTHRE